ncbi:hypothetical protein WJX72_006032 [[Myrmecia] bisecta]|uniref:Uncharacterized protein n=1 Tax=[Myrmecia] bisecta TaxID=41462 RepID=A0AAW1QFB3_9CHLO
MKASELKLVGGNQQDCHKNLKTGDVPHNRKHAQDWCSAAWKAYVTPSKKGLDNVISEVVQLAATLGLDPKTVQLDGVLKAYSSSGYTFTAIQGGDDRGSAIIVTGNPATGPDTPPRLLSRVTGIGGTVTAVLCNDIKVSALLRDKLTHKLVLTVEKFLTPFVILDAATAPTLSPQDVSGDPHDFDSNVQPMDIGAILERSRAATGFSTSH